MIQFDTNARVCGEFADTEFVRDKSRAAAARLVGALIDLSFGARVAKLTELAIKTSGPLLYVGSKDGALQRHLAAVGLPVTVLDPFDIVETGSQALLPAGVTEPFRLAILPMLAYAAWVERHDPNLLIDLVASSLAVDGALITDLSLPFASDAAFEVVDADIPLDGSVSPGRIGWRAETSTDAAYTRSYVVNGSWATPSGQRNSAALLVDREIEAAFERALIGAGLILVERGTAGGDPGGTLLATYKRRVVSPLCYPFSPLTQCSAPEKVLLLTEGDGSRVRDNGGKEYIDACSGLWNTHIGQGNREVIEAISAQLRRLSYGTLFAGRGNEPAMELAELLVSVAPYPLQWVCYTGSGSESTELGIRIARIFARLHDRSCATQIAHFDESYHGTFGISASVSALLPAKDLIQGCAIGVPIPTPNPAKCPPGMPYLDFVLRCADALEEKVCDGSVAAFIFEPILASAGIIIPPQEYWDRIQSICTKYNVLLIADEVATGFGRTGRWFACEHFGLRPDIMLMAKGINSGYLPLGAVMFSAAIGEKFLKHSLPLLHGSTYNGHPVCCASAIANIGILKRERLVERSAKMGHYFGVALDRLRELDIVAGIRGLGLMQAVILRQSDGKSAEPLQVLGTSKKIQAAGVLAYPMPSACGLCPPLNVSRSDIDLIVERLHAALSTLRLGNGAVHSIDPSTLAGNDVRLAAPHRA